MHYVSVLTHISLLFLEGNRLTNYRYIISIPCSNNALRESLPNSSIICWLNLRILCYATYNTYQEEFTQKKIAENMFIRSGMSVDLVLSCRAHKKSSAYKNKKSILQWNTINRAMGLRVQWLPSSHSISVLAKIEIMRLLNFLSEEHIAQRKRCT